MEMPEVVSHDVWAAARRKLLVKEKEWSLKRDALSAERRELPMEEVMKKYVFQGSEGPVKGRYLEEGASTSGKIGLRRHIKPRGKMPQLDQELCEWTEVVSRKLPSLS